MIDWLKRNIPIIILIIIASLLVIAVFICVLYGIGVFMEIVASRSEAINECVSYNANATNGSICLV
jgi:hypothetical protein